MLHCIAFAFLVVVLGIYLLLRTGFSLNGKPMRFDPSSGDGSSKTKSWYIEGVSAAGVPISCSFVEFDERGDFLDFNQHKDCQARLKHFAKAGKLLLVIYCHGWKNNSQSDNVPAFNCFLSKFATAIKPSACMAFILGGGVMFSVLTWTKLKGPPPTYNRRRNSAEPSSVLFITTPPLPSCPFTRT